MDCMAAPATLPYPGSCTNAISRRFCKLDPRSSFRSISLEKLSPERIVAHELTGAIHDHLWRINRSEAEPLAVSGLAIGEQARRVRILPPQLIPIIHVLA